MQSHGPKRVYTPHSLEFWFGKLEHDWSGAFTASQLEAGRQIYRDSEVRELELTDRDAIVHRRIEKKDEYAVIEWTSTGLSVRSSSTDTELAHALAVAGMHEIEELVADEISPLPGEPPRAGAGHAGGHGHGLGHGFTAGPATAHFRSEETMRSIRRVARFWRSSNSQESCSGGIPIIRVARRR
jgi:hypothetical protein